MKTLESILHMYLGCDVMTEDNRVGRLAGIDLCQKDNSITMLTIRYSDDTEDDWTVINDDGYFSRLKPILRPLDSMTEEEAKDLYDQMYPDVPRRDDFKARIIIDQVTGTGVYYEGKVSIIDYVNWYPWLLSKSFDLFGLIDSGLALNATKLEGYGK